MKGDFSTIRTVGSTVPPDLLERLVAGDSALGSLDSSAYHLLPGESPRNGAHRAWAYLKQAWAAFGPDVQARPASDPAVGFTRDRWLHILLSQLGFGRVPQAPAGGLSVAGRTYAVSHLWGHLPIHLLGWNVDLDRRTKGVPGAADRAPHPMVQELLNRSDDHLWAILTNGRKLRLLRDSTNLTGLSYVEFDLETMFAGDVFSDFVVLYLLLHESRFEVAEGQPPGTCVIERWRTSVRDLGVRALDDLKEGVSQAVELLGTGFLQHRANVTLRQQLETGDLRYDEFHRELLRLVYRLLFLFVAEERPERDLLLDPEVTPAQRQRWLSYYSSIPLRRRARVLRRTSHGDEWHRVWAVIHRLGLDGIPELGVPPLRGLFAPTHKEILTQARHVDIPDMTPPAPAHQLSNDALLAAVRAMSVIRPKGQPERVVDFGRLGAEELGGIYESLLERVPRLDLETRQFTLDAAKGNDRKTTGSYYTPTALIDLVLDEALDPVLDAAERASDPEAALLALAICDPACGSGHFLVAAAHRVAERLAAVRSGSTDLSPTELDRAMRDVVVSVIHGVDIQPLAAELAKVSLWLESMERGRPLAFLDHHIKVGNSLLGATPALLARGVPDAAYAVLTGDDKAVTTTLKKRNAQERLGSTGTLFDIGGVVESDRQFAARVASLHAVQRQRTLAEVEAAEARYRELAHDPELLRRHAEADTWCAAFVAEKIDLATGITTGTVADAAAGDLADVLTGVVTQAAEDYRFFHWHLEFPEVFRPKNAGDLAADDPTGWSGGFSVMLGNPPWETVQMTEKEFFAVTEPDIANAKSAAIRKRAIADLAVRNPNLFREFRRAAREAEATNSFVRSGRYPLTARGKIDTYAIFAELFRSSITSDGRMGIITPTGLATGATTAAFFADTLTAKRLAAFYDFENEAKIFPGVHNQFRFAATSVSGGEALSNVRMAFYTRFIGDVAARRFELSAAEILAINPNTGTLPLFRGRRDADITLAAYRRFPVLRRDRPAANPWSLEFRQGLFNMASDSGLFRQPDELRETGAVFDGWSWSAGTKRWLPLYEAKMLGHFDHRYSTYTGASQAQLNKGTLPRLTDAQHDDPEVEPLARYWVDESDVNSALEGLWDRGWVLGCRRLTQSSNLRTLIPFVAPRTSFGDNAWLLLPGQPRSSDLLAALSSFASDYIVRTKLSGTTLSSYIIEQVAFPPPDAFQVTLAGVSDAAYGDWVRPRVLELTYTSWRIAAYANDCLGLPPDADPGPPFRWDPARRDTLRAELDAAMFHLYGLPRADVEHVMDSFAVVRKYDERDHGEFRTKRRILEIYDAMAAAAERGQTYRTTLTPPPGYGPRHPRR